MRRDLQALRHAQVEVVIKKEVQPETLRLTVGGASYGLDEIASMVVQHLEDQERLQAGEALATAVQSYFNKRGLGHASHRNNEDIADLADALAEYGYVEQSSR